MRLFSELGELPVTEITALFSITVAYANCLSIWIDKQTWVVERIGVAVPRLRIRGPCPGVLGVDAEEPPQRPGVVTGEEVVQIGLVVAFLAGELVPAIEERGEAGVGAAVAESVGDFLAEGGVVVAGGVAFVLLGDETGGAEVVGGAVEGASGSGGVCGVLGGQAAEGAVLVPSRCPRSGRR